MYNYNEHAITANCNGIIYDYWVIDGGWGPWMCEPSACTCGGSQTCTRKCDIPPPSCGGKGCDGPSTITRSCNCYLGKTIT